MRVPVKDMNGQQVGDIELSESVFAAPVNQTVMHQALVRQLSNRRQGTHDTKGRSEVAGGGKKPWRQKGTGRARQGSTRAPNWVGGGIAFGPTPAQVYQGAAQEDESCGAAQRTYREGRGRPDRGHRECRHGRSPRPRPC